MNTPAKKITVQFTQALRNACINPSAQQSAHGSANAVLTPGASALATQAQVDSGREQSNEPPAEELLEQLFAQLEQLETSRCESLATIRLIAVDLSIAVASKILFQEIDENRFPVKELVDQMIKKTSGLDSNEPVKIQLHPAELERLSSGSTLASIQEQHNGKLEWIANPAIGRGNAELDATRFTLLYDGSIQLKEIRQSLLEMLADAENERRKNGNRDTDLRRFPDRRASG